MKKDYRRASEMDENTPEELVAAHEEGREPRHQSSLTAVAEEAALIGTLNPALRSGRDYIPGEDALLAGDADGDLLESEYVGDEVPGGSMPTPDQNNVDDIGRAYGLTDEDSGALISAEQLVERRDSHRWELDPRSKDPEL